ncbi:MAG: type IV pilus assembly protein PilM [Actinobacteria bacterium]|nr:type IV pilus assembly protein PilM [Actinomycetota bacterium]
MAKSAVGLDIGSSGVQVSQVTVTRGQPTLVNFGGVALPEGAVREGEIIDVSAVSAAVKQLMSDARIKEKNAWLGVANQRVVVRQIDLPYMEEQELRDSLRFQVQEYIPIPVEDAELDYHRLDEYTEGDQRMQRLLLVAAHRDMVQSHIAAASDAGLRPAGVDLNSFAILRALANERSVSQGSEVLIDIGAGVTNIVVHENGTPRFVRILVLGGSDITEALASGLGIAHADAEALKIQTGLSGAGDEGARRIIDDRANQFVDEARGSLDYYQAQTGSARIGRVVLSGGGSKLAGLPERLANAVRLPVEVGRPLDHLPVKGTSYSRDDLADVEPILATSIGLALGGVE